MSGATGIVTLVALGVRVILWTARPGLTYDGTYYLRQAERLLHGDYQIVGFPPGYPLVVALVRLVVGDFELAGRLVSLAVGTATVAIFHVWARRKLPARFALAGALFLAIHPEVARTSVEILSEPLYILCIVLGVVAFERRRDLAAGALFGYAFLVRPEALALLLGCASLRVWEARRAFAVSANPTERTNPTPRHGSDPIARRPHPAAWPLRLLMAGFVPVFAFSAIATRAVGHWVLTPKQGQIDLDADVWHRLWATLTSLHVVFPLLLVPGALVLGWRTRSVLLAGLVYVAALPFFAIHIQPRLLQPALPFLLVLGTMWIASLRPRWRHTALAVVAGLAVWGAASPFAALLQPAIVAPQDKTLGAALKPHLRFDDRVASRFPFVPYYAGAGFVNAPLASYPVTMDSLVAMGATHLLILEHEVLDMLPQLRPLFDDAALITLESRLELVTAVTPSTGPRALLYRFHAPALAMGEMVDRTAVAAAWAGPALLFVTQDGRVHAHPALEAGQAPVGLASITNARDLGTSGDGPRAVLVLEQDGPRLAEVDLRTGELRLYHATAADAPSSPAYVGDAIVYVRSAGGGGIRVLEPATGRVRPVHFAGLEAAEARPLFVTTRGTAVAITYVRPQREHDEHRVVAVAVWPTVAAADTAVVLAGRWATQQSLADDAVAWLAGEDRLVGSIAIQDIDDDGRVVGSFSWLAVFAADGRTRAFGFGMAAPRRPVLQNDRIAFITDGAVLRTATLRPAALQFPAVHAFDAPRAAVRRRP